MNRHSNSHQSPGGNASQHLQSTPQSGYGGPVEIPTTQPGQSTRERNGSTAGQQSLNMGKSPPNMPNKNTKHVPCKFFRQGQCQAGNACPFLHTHDPMSHQAPCKYFMKGNCKFGGKCALAHYLPNGQRVSKADLNTLIPRRHNQNQNQGQSQSQNQSQNQNQDPNQNQSSGQNQSQSQNIRSQHDPFRSPQLESHQQQQTYLGPPLTSLTYQSQQQPDSLSQPQQANLFSSHDYPFLDDEFDPAPERANGWSSFTRGYDSAIGSPPTSQYGSPPNDAFSPSRRIPSALNAPLPPSWTASVPNYAKFGPLGASMPDKFGLGSPPNSTLLAPVGSPPNRETATRPGQAIGIRNTPLGTSPATVESSIGQRIMSSQRFAPIGRDRMSASVPVRDLEDRFGELESDLPFIPSELHDELLAPNEKSRRMSRPEQDLAGSFKEMSGGLAIPRRGSNALGSSPSSGSPSRFTGLFDQMEKEKKSGLGVGSPLRGSWMPNGTSSTSSRQGIQIPGISQAMARVDLNRTDSSDSTSFRTSVRGNYARQISSPGLSSQRIDEEGEGAFFPMDTEDSSRRANPAWIESQKATPASLGAVQSKPKGATQPLFDFQE